MYVAIPKIKDTSQSRNDVTVFESGGYIGGHTNTIRVNEGARELAVDTGFIVFNEINYPNLCRLFDELGVQSRDSDMSFSVHCDRTGIEYNGTDFNALFAQRRNLVSPRFWGMLAEIVRFNREAPEQLVVVSGAVRQSFQRRRVQLAHPLGVQAGLNDLSGA